MSVQFTVDTREFNDALKSLVSETGKDEKKVLINEMRLLVERLVQFTAPFHGKGTSKAAQKVGENAVSRDIQKVFVGADLKFINSMKKRQGSKMELPRFVDRLDPQEHLKKRNSRGRINKKIKGIKLGNLNLDNRIYVPKKELKDYIKTVQAHVGRAKAGWMAAALKFGSKSIPAWVKRHGTKDGEAHESFGVLNSFVEAVNKNKAIGGLESGTQLLSQAIGSRIRDIQIKLEGILERNARKHSSK